MRRNLGQELPGIFNPLIVGVLFYEQAQPWPNIIHSRYGKLTAAVKATLAQILQYAADETTRERLLRDIINPAVDRHLEKLEAKVSEVLRPHTNGHPITYNHYLTETMQRVQYERNKKLLRQRMNRFFDVPLTDSAAFVSEHFDTSDLLRALLPSNEADMERDACSLAVDCMEAYYQVTWLGLLPFVRFKMKSNCCADCHEGSR